MKYINTKINIVSLYYLYKGHKHEDFIEFSQDFLNSLDKNAINIIGQDSNAKVEIAYQDEELLEHNIRKYNNKRRNKKGYSLLHMI